MKKEKISVALICGFSNAKVRAHLPLDNRKLYNIARWLLGMPAKSGTYGDVAAWDTHLIEYMRLRDDVELHVISSHSGLKKGVVSFEEDGVDYHFVRSDRATLLKRLIPSASLWHKLNPIRPAVRKIVRRINPDIIALVGAENPHISGTVLGLDEYPLIVKCQTIYNNPELKEKITLNPKNAYVEKLILERVKYVAVNTKMHYHAFRQINKTAYNFHWPFGFLYPEVKPINVKKYDFVNFAVEMCDVKGFSDSVKALAIVKQSFPNVKLNLVGGGTSEYRNNLDRLIRELNLQDNVFFTPFFPIQADLFQHLQNSRYALIPSKMDSISSTIRQAMHYGLPVVCYKTPGTPLLNQDNECVLIAENSDVNDLASKMTLLLSNPSKAEELKNNSTKYDKVLNDDSKKISIVVDNFKAIIANSQDGVPIPQNLICEYE